MYYSLFVHGEIDDDGNPQGGAIPKQGGSSSIGQMGMSSEFFMPPHVIAQGPHDQTAPSSLGAALQSGVGAPPPPPPPPPPPTLALHSAVLAAASAPTNVAFPLPTMTPAVVSASTNPAPSQIAFPTAQAVDPSSAQVLTAGATGFSSGQVSQTDQQHQTSVPRMTPGQFLSHSSRYFCSSLESVF